MFGDNHSDESAPRRPNGRKPWAQRARACSGPALAFCAALGAAGLLAQTQCTSIAGLDELTFTGTGTGTGLWLGWGGEGGTGTGTGGAEAGGGATCGTTPTPPQATCPGEICNGGCPDPTTCKVDCGGPSDNPCANEEFICPPGFHCLVECGALPGCASTDIFCPATYNCLVRCNEADTCFNADVHCSDSGTCELECSAASKSCAITRLDCGANSCHATCNGSSEPDVACGPSCDCQPCS